MKNLAVITTRISYYDCYFLIVPNIASGRRGRYTVYQIPTSDGQRVKVVGRELPLAFAKKLVGKLATNKKLITKRREKLAIVHDREWELTHYP